MSSTSVASSTASSSRPSFKRSISTPVNKGLKSLKAASKASLQKIPSFTELKARTRSSVPVFTTPDYTAPSSAAVSIPEISPLTPRPAVMRATTMPAPVRAIRTTALKPVLKKALHWHPHTASVSSEASFSTATSTSSSMDTITTTSGRSRSSSVSSVESFSSTEEEITFALRLHAFPSTIWGLIMSILAVTLVLFVPMLAPRAPRRTLITDPHTRDIVLTEEQLRTQPQAPATTLLTAVSQHIISTYHHALRRTTKARQAHGAHAILAALFTSTRVRATLPTPVDPKTLLAEVPFVVDSPPGAPPLPKGPAPPVAPAPAAKKKSVRFIDIPDIIRHHPTPVVFRDDPELAEALSAGW